MTDGALPYRASGRLPNASGRLRFHDTRHSCATWLVTDGVQVHIVQRVMGHEDEDERTY